MGHKPNALNALTLPLGETKTVPLPRGPPSSPPRPQSPATGLVQLFPSIYSGPGFAMLQTLFLLCWGSGEGDKDRSIENPRPSRPPGKGEHRGGLEKGPGPEEGAPASSPTGAVRKSFLAEGSAGAQAQGWGGRAGARKGLGRSGWGREITENSGEEFGTETTSRTSIGDFKLGVDLNLFLQVPPAFRVEKNIGGARLGMKRP